MRVIPIPCCCSIVGCRYLDRRRAERGPYYLMSNVLPYHPHFLWMRNSHDYEAAEALAARREKDRELVSCGTLSCVDPL